ncbi:MAG: hypothetical protein NTX00_01410 [Candidatus Parcubacteria bacterium]|nr:hypothetical protein [Candidatus Parcubacteria bacterium]
MRNKIARVIIIILVVIFGIVVGVLIFSHAPQSEQLIQKRDINMPADKKTCEALGGNWGKIGLSPIEQCNLPTKDAEKKCTDSSDCQGSCIAEKSGVDWEKDFRGNIIGKCTAWKITLGCQDFVNDGKVRIICVD